MPDLVGRIHRNLTSELIEGGSDGAVKKSAPNWGNRHLDETDAARHVLSHVEGGFDWEPEGVTEPHCRAYVHGYVAGA